MSGHSPHPDDDDAERAMDAEWHEIVKNIGDLDFDATIEESQATRTTANHPTGDESVDADGWVDQDEPFSATPGARDWSPVEEEEHFVAPDPGPITTRDPFVALCWVGVIAGAIVLVVAAFVLNNPPRWLAWAAGAVLLASIIALVWRLPWERSNGDDHDGGAVV